MIKQGTKLSSDMSGVLIENQRQPNYATKKKKYKMIEQRDTMSDYVRKNVKEVDERNKEYR